MHPAAAGMLQSALHWRQRCIKGCCSSPLVAQRCKTKTTHRCIPAMPRSPTATRKSHVHVQHGPLPLALLWKRAAGCRVGSVGCSPLATMMMICIRTHWQLASHSHTRAATSLAWKHERSMAQSAAPGSTGLYHAQSAVMLSLQHSLLTAAAIWIVVWSCMTGASSSASHWPSKL